MHWHHYLIDDLYTPVWPNIAASAILGLWALKRFIKLEKLHNAHKEKLEVIHNAVRSQREE